jgi:hypothetical protein
MFLNKTECHITLAKAIKNVSPAMIPFFAFFKVIRAEKPHLLHTSDVAYVIPIAIQ